jgi:hypothetical protein
MCHLETNLVSVIILAVSSGLMGFLACSVFHIAGVRLNTVPGVGMRPISLFTNSYNSAQLWGKYEHLREHGRRNTVTRWSETNVDSGQQIQSISSRHLSVC